MKFTEFVAKKLGTEKWVVSPRLTAAHRAKGFDLAVPAHVFEGLRNEYRAKNKAVRKKVTRALKTGRLPWPRVALP